MKVNVQFYKQLEPGICRIRLSWHRTGSWPFDGLCYQWLYGKPYSWDNTVATECLDLLEQFHGFNRSNVRFNHNHGA